MASASFKESNLDNGDDDGDLTGVALKLKKSLNVSDLNDAAGFTFEVDPATDDMLEDILDLEHETGMNREPKDHYLTDYIGDSSKSQAMRDCITDNEKLGDFVSTVKLMDDVTGDTKVKKLIIRAGTSKDVIPSDGKVIYHFEAYATGKEAPIDSSLQRGFPNTLIFANHGCIQGLYIALQTMRVGEISKFWFHYDMAYRAMGIPPRIPAKAHILCAVEILAANPKEIVQDIFQMSIDERRDLPFKKILDSAREMKEGGNDHFGKKEYRLAITCYRKGIDLLEHYAVTTLAHEQMRSELLGALYGNLAQSYLNIKDGQKACKAAKCGLQLPQYKLRYKLYFKFAKGKEMLKEYRDSVDLCRKALGCLTPGLTKEKDEIQAFLNELNQRLKAQEHDLKLMYEKMLGQKKGNGQPEKEEGEDE